MLTKSIQLASDYNGVSCHNKNPKMPFNCIHSVLLLFCIFKNHERPPENEILLTPKNDNLTHQCYNKFAQNSFLLSRNNSLSVLQETDTKYKELRTFIDLLKTRPVQKWNLTSHYNNNNVGNIFKCVESCFHVFFNESTNDTNKQLVKPNVIDLIHYYFNFSRLKVHENEAVFKRLKRSNLNNPIQEDVSDSILTSLKLPNDVNTTEVYLEFVKMMDHRALQRQL